MKSAKRILWIESNDGKGVPCGGTLSNTIYFLALLREQSRLVTFKGIDWDSKGITDCLTVPPLLNLLPSKRIISVFIFLLNLRKMHEYDVVVSQSPELLIVMKLLNASKRVFIFAGLSNSAEISPKKWVRILSSIYSLYLTVFLKYIDKCFAVSDLGTIQKFSLKTGLSLHQAYSYSDFVFRNEQRQNKLIFVGRLEEVKNVENLIEAFLQSKLYKKNWQLEIIGDGSLGRFLTNKYRNEDVVFRGRLSSEQIQEALSSAKLACCVSYTEGWPTVAVEAGLTGTPLLLTPFGAALELESLHDNIRVTKGFTSEDILCELNAYKRSCCLGDIDYYEISKIFQANFGKEAANNFLNDVVN